MSKPFIAKGYERAVLRDGHVVELLTIGPMFPEGEPKLFFRVFESGVWRDSQGGCPVIEYSIAELNESAARLRGLQLLEEARQLSKKEDTT